MDIIGMDTTLGRIKASNPALVADVEKYLAGHALARDGHKVLGLAWSQWGHTLYLHADLGDRPHGRHVVWTVLFDVADGVSFDNGAYFDKLDRSHAYFIGRIS